MSETSASRAIGFRGTKMANSKLKRLVEKRDAVNARIKLEQNKLRSNERKSDTRRKILAGATVLQWAERDSEFSSRLMAELKRFLVRDADRALFGLPTIMKKEDSDAA
ncbi:MAG: mobilization protein [Candidatus Korobacteraceae bacterium]